MSETLDTLSRDSVPSGIRLSDGYPIVEWIDTGGRSFTEPFFEDTIYILRTENNDKSSLVTPIDVLATQYDEDRRGLPNGFIYHISRCGSTLVSQMLAASPRNVVISEAPPIDAMLRMIKTKNAPEESLKWIVNAYAPRIPDRRFFIKLDSWSVIDFDLISSSFPDVPWIFLYRDPVEVIVSLLRQPGLHAVPGVIDGLIEDIDPVDLLVMSGEEYSARVLARFLAEGLSMADQPSGMLINYTQLPDAVTGAIAEHFRVTLEASELDQMRSASTRHAKSPANTFTPDSEKKRSEATDAVRSAAAIWTNPLYLRLEKRRGLDTT